MLAYTLATAAIAVASSANQQHHTASHQQYHHEPLGYGYRTRHNPGELTPHSTNDNNDNIIVHASSYLQPNTFEDHLFTSGSGSSTSASHYHSTKHHNNNNNSNANNDSPKSKLQQQQQHQSIDIDMKSLLNINRHRIFQLHDGDTSSSLRQTIRQQDQQRPPANDNCSMASIISTLPYATQSTTVGSTSNFPNTPSCGAEANTQGVWYTFTPSVSGLYKTYVNSGLNLGIRIYSGTCSTSGDDVSNLACVSQFNSLHTFIGVANTEYKLLISEQDNNSSSSSEGTSFVFVLQNNNETPFPTAAKDKMSVSPTNSPSIVKQVATRPPATPFPTLSNVDNNNDNDTTDTIDQSTVGPAEINFIDLTSEISNTNNNQDIMLVMNYEIGTNRQFNANLYEPDCITPLNSDIDIESSTPMVIPVDNGGVVYDKVTLLYTIDQSTINGDTLNLCVVFQLKDSEGISTIIQEKLQVSLEISSSSETGEENVNGGGGNVVMTSSPVMAPPQPQPQPQTPPTTPSDGSCSVCSTGLTVPSSTPVGSGSKVCANLLIDASNVLEGSAQCISMEGAIPTCCPEIVVTDRPTMRPTLKPIVTLPPITSSQLPDNGVPPPPPSPPSNPTPDYYGWGVAAKPGSSPSPPSSSSWHGGSSSGSSKPKPCDNGWSGNGWLFTSSGKSGKSGCGKGGKSSKSSKSSKSQGQGKSGKKSWHGNGWYNGYSIQGVSELDRIRIETNDAGYNMGRSVGYGLMLSLVVGIVIAWMV